MSSLMATSSLYYRILGSKEAHNYFDNTNCTTRLCNYILKLCPNYINLTLDENVTPTDLNLLQTAIRCTRSRVALIETIKKLEDPIVDRNINMLLLSKPTQCPKLETPLTPSLPSSAKVSEPKTPPITVNLCMSSDNNPSSAHLSPIMICLFLFFYLFTSCAPSHDPQSISLSIAAQCLTYNACRTFWNYLYKNSMECLIANICSPTSIYSFFFFFLKSTIYSMVLMRQSTGHRNTNLLT